MFVLNDDIDIFYMHNQRGYGRPTVTSALAIADYVINCFEADRATHVNKREIHLMACRPFDRPEIFHYHDPEPCSLDIEAEWLDNDNGYAVLNIDLITKKIYIKFYNTNFEELSAVEYIEWENCQSYCDDDWVARAKKRHKKLNEAMTGDDQEYDVDKMYQRILDANKGT